MAFALTRLTDLASPARLVRAVAASGVRDRWQVRDVAADDEVQAAEARELAQKVRMLADGVASAGFNLLNAMVVAALFWSSYPRALLTVWLSLTATVVAARFLLLRSYKADRAFRPAFWARWFSIGAAASGACWGALALASLFTGSMVEHVFVAFVIAGTTAGGIATLAPHMPAYVAYLGLSVGPLALAFLSEPDPIYLGMGTLSLLYLVVMMMTARSYNRSLSATVRLQIENLDLNAKLTAARNAADRASREKWEALGHLSHELRTPMNAVLGFSDALRREMFGPLGSPKYLEYSSHVHESGAHVLDLVNEILSLAQAETGALTLALQELDAGQCGRDCLTITSGLAASKGVRLDSDIPGALPPIRADRMKLRQVLLNLLSNALKYTPTGGHVRLELAAGEGELTIRVRDDGIGIAPEDIPKALQPFVRLSNPLTQNTEGTGLGLPLSKRLVEMHGGTLEVASARDRGTVVTVRLPLDGAPGAASPSV